jgi:hypothetical protein
VILAVQHESYAAGAVGRFYDPDGTRVSPDGHYRRWKLLNLL